MKPLQRRLKALTDTRDIMRQIQLDTIAGAKAKVPRKTGFLGRSILPGSVSDTSLAASALLQPGPAISATRSSTTSRTAGSSNTASTAAWTAAS